MITLGNITFEAFEVPSSVSLGGKQLVVVHHLAGGQRLVDTLGSDDANIAWQGVLSGPQAVERAKALDELRISGDSVVLAWSSFYYSVLVTDLRLEFRSDWWIPYSLSCTIVSNSISTNSAFVSSATEVLADLGLAQAYRDVSALNALAGTAQAMVPGSLAYQGFSGQLSVQAQQTELEMDSLVSVGTSGSLAGQAAAAGVAANASSCWCYLSLALSNLQSIGQT